MRYHFRKIEEPTPNPMHHIIHSILLRTLPALIACLCLAAQAQAQTCDELFNSGVKAQQTMTISSQRSAISYFEKAKVCYDSQAKKTSCDEHIATCKNIIAQLQKAAQQTSQANTAAEQAAREQAIADSIAAAEQAAQEALQREADQYDMVFYVDQEGIELPASGKESGRVQVTCNKDWSISSHSDWLTCTVNWSTYQVIIVPEQNTAKEKRFGNVVLTCKDKDIIITVTQNKAKKYGLF